VHGRDCRPRWRHDVAAVCATRGAGPAGARAVGGHWSCLRAMVVRIGTAAAGERRRQNRGARIGVGVVGPVVGVDRLRRAVDVRPLDRLLERHGEAPVRRRQSRNRQLRALGAHRCAHAAHRSPRRRRDHRHGRRQHSDGNDVARRRTVRRAAGAGRAGARHADACVGRGPPALRTSCARRTHRSRSPPVSRRRT
jgi:hypothetical protein